jgi:RNA polymerase sigma-70 factor (ECF subfamily)
MQHRPFPFARPRDSIVGVSTIAADDQAFAALIERHRRELHAHCARMLHSPADAEDALQETLLRAWRSRRTLASNAARPWLYRIATNTCFDVVARRGPKHASLDDEAAFSAEGPLEAAAPPDQRPDAIVLAQETLELALLAAVQRLPPRQHATLVLRDVLSLSAGEAATAMGTSVAATNSAVQRARNGLRTLLAADRLEWECASPSPGERRTLRRYLSAVQA